jgi:hypothetical protein
LARNILVIVVDLLVVLDAMSGPARDNPTDVPTRTMEEKSPFKKTFEGIRERKRRTDRSKLLEGGPIYPSTSIKVGQHHSLYILVTRTPMMLPTDPYFMLPTDTYLMLPADPHEVLQEGRGEPPQGRRVVARRRCERKMIVKA